ncbi:MAG: hypothetical protein BZY80_03220 [SAR202 cluster bacterium Io17-Chloro-G2]|nr:MAG: hypothetical protein BZY80_03220 [SAR202 cluster bacterium Io17-Chloro-G2]
MKRINLFEIVGKRVLVTRESARSLETIVLTALVEGQGEVELDFSGVDGLTPSFFDETLAILEESAVEGDESQFHILMTNPPTELSSKFAAVSRGHNLALDELENGTWVITKSIQREGET